MTNHDVICDFNDKLDKLELENQTLRNEMKKLTKRLALKDHELSRLKFCISQLSVDATKYGYASLGRRLKDLGKE